MVIDVMVEKGGFVGRCLVVWCNVVILFVVWEFLGWFQLVVSGVLLVLSVVFVCFWQD